MQCKLSFLGAGGKTFYPGKNLSDQSREPTKDTLRRVWESNPGHTGGRLISLPVAGSRPVAGSKKVAYPPTI